jgi:hypothetical protein
MRASAPSEEKLTKKVSSEESLIASTIHSGGADVIRLPVPGAIDSNPGNSVNADERLKVNEP